VKAVGIRDLKNRLSEHLRHVRAGESILVTDRGEVVAELSRPGSGAKAIGVPAGLAELARLGYVALAPRPSNSKLYPAMTRVLKSSSSAALLKQERGER
jgi:antitoxin (DNA-binding transcriptional repressor) of toxin-antitoxin stability system